MNSTSSSTDHNIALSFSGGGFRAAGFSLGTMVLLKQIDWLKKVQMISSSSGGSITAAFFVVAKAHFVSQHKGTATEDIFPFDQFMSLFYTRLKSFLESENVVNSILQDLGGREKVIKRAANCYQKELENLMGHPTSDAEIMEQIWGLLEANNISPDCLSINSTNMTDASLFRFAFLRTQDQGQDIKAVVIGGEYQNISNSDPLTLQLYCKLKLGDMIAASSCFPIGFEPILYPDDFSNSEDDKRTLIKFLRNQDQVALMDAGLYDNLALTSIESLRQDAKKDENENNSKITLPYPINFVIATDADNLEPASALLDPQQLNQGLENLPQWSKWVIKILDIILKPFPILEKLVHGLFSQFGIKKIDTQVSDSWHLTLPRLIGLLPDRIKELSPTFGAFLKRNRNLTYQFLQYKYEQESNISLIRNLIFDLYNRNDQDVNLQELVPNLTNINTPLTNSSQEELKGMIRKINTLALALTINENPEVEIDNLVKIYENNEENNQNYLICLAKLATALPTTLWLKWYTICQIQPKPKNSPSDFIKAILEDDSLCIWKTQQEEGDKTNLLMEFAGKEGEKMATAAEVVIACGFVAACYNLLEYSANKLGILYSEKNSETTLPKLSKTDRQDFEQLRSLGQNLKPELTKLGLEGIEKAALIWWEIISFTPSGSKEEDKLHSFIKNVLTQMINSPEKD